jgi:AraC family transcriptional regulator
MTSGRPAFPAEIVRHRTAHWRGVQAKTVQIISHEHFEYSFQQQCHLIVAVEQGVRYDGETFVEGLPTSTMRNYSHKLIFVPAGRRFFRCADLRGDARGAPHQFWNQ